MAFLLARRGLFPRHSTHVREHPEVLQLRFDAEHSPVHCTPESLRRGVWRLCLRYAAGSARLRGGRWRRFDPLRHPDANLPYPFA
jgi:hypothetical protein